MIALHRAAAFRPVPVRAQAQRFEETTEVLQLINAVHRQQQFVLFCRHSFYLCVCEFLFHEVGDSSNVRYEARLLLLLLSLLLIVRGHVCEIVSDEGPTVPAQII